MILFLISSIIFAKLDISNYKLDNGLRVYIATNDTAPMCAYSISYAVGSSCEYKGITGISHMLEHLMFKQLEGYNIGDIDKIISKVGGLGFNANTGHDYTNYIVQVPCKNLKKILEIDRDRLTKLRITQESLNIEKQVVLSERKMRLENSVFGKMFYFLNMSLMAGTPYAHPVIGTTYDIKHYKADTVLDYYHKHYTPNNATVIVVSGKYPKKNILKDIKATLGTVPRGPQSLCNGVPIKTKYKKQFFVKTNTQQDAVILGYNFNLTDKTDIFLLSLLDQVLSYGSNALLDRFFKNKGIGFTGEYYEVLKNKTANLYLYALALNKQKSWQDLKETFEALNKYLIENAGTELKRIWNLKKLDFYEDLEKSDTTRDLIKDAVIYYGNFSTLEKFYKLQYNDILPKFKAFISRILGSKSVFLISRGVK